MKQLIRRVSWTVCILVVFEVGNTILLPGFPFKDYVNGLKQNAYVNIVSSNFGSQITVPSLFALGMGPYMTALIVWQMITITNEEKFQKMTQKVAGFWQKVITLAITLIQAFAISFLFLKYKPSIGNFKSHDMYWIIVIILIAGGMFVVWIADLNAKKGIGGTSVLIIPGLIKNLPTVLNSGLKKPISFSVATWGLVLIFLFIFIFTSIYIYSAELRIKIERINIENELTNSYIPIKVLVSGAMPFMFALSLYSVPLLILSRFKINSALYRIISSAFSYHTWQGILLYGLIILLLGYGFAFVNVRPNKIAKSLRENGDYIFNILPGQETEEYLKHKIYTMTFLGNIYLLFISLVPLIIGKYIPVVTNFSFLFGSILILITMLDTIYQEIRALLIKGQYRIF